MSDDLLQQSWFQALELQGLTERQIERAKEQLLAVSRIMDEHREAAAAISANRDYSPEGRKRKLADLMQATAQRLNRISEDVGERIDAHIAQLEQKLTPTDPPGNEVVRALRAQEIRSLLRKKTELEIVAEYLGWATGGESDEGMYAVETSPPGFALISQPEVLAQGKALRAARQHPDLSKELGQLKRFRAQILGAVETAKAELNIPQDDWVSRLAASDAA